MARLTYQQREQRSIRRKAYLTIAGVVLAGLVIMNAVGKSSTAKAPASAASVISADAHDPAPDESTFEGGLAADHNRDLYGHPWPQTAAEKAADASWDAVQDAQHELIGIGGDYKAYNASVTTAYRHWEQLETAAYGQGWRALWSARHTGDVLGECGSLQKLGMTHTECVQAERAQGDIEPLEPMLMHCSPDGTVMPHDAISCRTHGRESEDSVRRAAQAAGESVGNLSSN